MSKSSTAPPPLPPPSTAVIRPEDYIHSPVHYAVAVTDHAALHRLLSNVPKLADPNTIRTESDSLAQETLAEQIAAVLDRRDNRLRETPLHLAVRLNDAVSARALATAGADVSLQNAAGWNPLQEAILRRCPEIVSTLVQHHHVAAWSKWWRRMPRLVAALRRMRDFYMEISFHFESSIVPFVGKIAPSDTYRIWKRDGNLRADTSLAGYDGLKIQRANQSVLFLNDTVFGQNEPKPGSLLIVNHDEKKIYNAFENSSSPLSDAQISSFCEQTSVYRPGMDVTKAELIASTNWRRQEKMETVAEWKAKVYEMQNVIFSVKSRKVNAGDDLYGQTCVLPLEMDEESDDGYIVAENPRFSVSDDWRRRRHSSFTRDQREFVTVSRKSVDIIPVRRRPVAPPERLVAPPRTKEKEYVKSLRPVVWLTEQFPLKTEELLPLLDILAAKVKAVRRMRELLTATFPYGTFPVKVAIPVIPTVRVVITFTKFVELHPIENFYTPLSSPAQFVDTSGSENEDEITSSRSNYSSSWLSRSSCRSCSTSKDIMDADPFSIPSGYSRSSFNGHSWNSSDDDKNRKMKKTKSTKRTK